MTSRIGVILPSLGMGQRASQPRVDSWDEVIEALTTL